MRLLPRPKSLLSLLPVSPVCCFNLNMSDGAGITLSFWSLIRGKTTDDDLEEHEDALQQRRRQGLSQAYGVGYEWVTQPWTWSSLQQAYHWEDVDHLFKGVCPVEWNRVKEENRE